MRRQIYASNPQMTMPGEYNIQAHMNEYIFAKLIEDENVRRHRAGEPLIMVSQGKVLHKALQDELGKTMNKSGVPFNFSNTGRMGFVQALDRVMKQHGVGEKFDVNTNYERYMTHQNQFCELAGLQPGQAGRAAREAGTAPIEGWYPVSPYDDFYAQRMTVINHGSEVLYAPMSQMVRYSQTTNPETNQDIHFMSYQNILDARENNLELQRLSVDNNGNVRAFRAGNAYTQEDACGLSMLMPYMTENEYKSVGSWMNVPPADRMSPQGAQLSAKILQHLSENGIPYTVMRDKKKGQLKAKISNTKMEIRLTETAQNQQYIGRIYDDGISMYLRGSDKTYIPTEADIMTLIDYALGRNVNKVNHYANVDGRVGSSVSTKQKQGFRNLSYVREEKDGSLTYHASAGYSDRTRQVGDSQRRHIIEIVTTNNHSAAHMRFETPEAAEEFLRESISNARENFEALVDVDMLIREAAEHEGEEGYVPPFSSDERIAPLQATYWEVLRGESALYRPESKVDEETFGPLFAALGLNGAEDLDDDDYIEDDDETVIEHIDTHDGRQLYDGSREEQVRNHLRENMDVLFGTYEEASDGKRFNPALVSSFMESANGVYRNYDNMAAAMNKLEFTGDELRGDDFQNGTIKDKLIRFNPATARPMKDLESPFMKHMFDTIRETIETTAATVNPADILIDDNGIVHYTASQAVGVRTGERRTLEGVVGQIFEPNEQGLVETRYNGSTNKLFAPGYDAYILMPDSNNPTHFVDRTRYRGMEQMLAANIASQIRADMTHGDDEVFRDSEGNALGAYIGETTSINNTYRDIPTTGFRIMIEREPGESLTETYYRQQEMTGMPKEMTDAIIETAANTISYPTSIANEGLQGVHGGLYSEDEMGEIYVATNDGRYDVQKVILGGKSMAVTSEGALGRTDVYNTGSGKTQGKNRNFVKGTVVDRDGVAHAPQDANGNYTSFYDPMTTTLIAHLGHDVLEKPADRAQMVGSNLKTAPGIAGWETRQDSQGRDVQGVGVAQLTLQGLTFDDGAVISKRFAEENGVLVEGGEKRPLQPGDKICDFAGNKSIIAKVIDPEMSLEDAEKLQIRESVELFKLNPDLDVVQAPYSAVSRYNAAGALLAMRTPTDLQLPGGKTAEGCLGFAPMIITKHTAEDHTKIYDKSGRNFSGQQGWMTSALDMPALMDEVFSRNNSAITNLREVYNAMGLDIDEVGTMRKGYDPHVGEERTILQMPDAERLASMTDRELKQEFMHVIGARGGFLEIPFDMELPSGVHLQKIPPEQSSRPDRDMYALPIMSSHLRSGQTFEDGQSMAHDYTNQYAAVFTSALKYLKEDEKGLEASEKLKTQYQYDVTSSYANITDSLRHRMFDTKHNMMRDSLMSRRVDHSATSVWTPDTKLGLNEVAMNAEMMEHLGVKEGQRVLIWRDPLLRTKGMNYLKVRQDDNLHGVAVNPLIASMFDGDFDGDSAGLMRVSTEAARKECMAKLSMESRMLDFTQQRENGDYALIFNTGMDVVSSEVQNPELKERRMQLEREVNAVYRANLTPEQRQAKNEELCGKLSDWARDTLLHTCGTEIVSYKDLQSHIESLSTMVDHGAKGSHKKLAHYAHYMGLEYQTEPNGRIISDTVTRSQESKITVQDIHDTQTATAIKSFGTGLAGTVSQRMVTMLRNRGMVDKDDASYRRVENAQGMMYGNALESALELTYLATQGILQAKHDPKQAQILFDSVRGPIREVWRGHALEKKDTLEGPKWVTRKVMDANGNMVPEQASREAWIDSFLALHSDPDGLDLGDSINREMVEQVADALYNPETHKMLDLEDEATIRKFAAPMDIMAYRTTNAFETACEFAEEGRNLFEGACNVYFAPKVISKNMQVLRENQEKLARGEITPEQLKEGMRPVVKQDVLVGYEKSEAKSLAASVIEIEKEDMQMAQAKGIDVVPDAPITDRVPKQEEPTVDDVVEPSTEQASSGLTIDYSKSVQAEPEVAPTRNRGAEAESRLGTVSGPDVGGQKGLGE